MKYSFETIQRCYFYIYNLFFKNCCDALIRKKNPNTGQDIKRSEPKYDKNVIKKPTLTFGPAELCTFNMLLQFRICSNLVVTFIPKRRYH